jgi:hypothetical protein
MSFPFNKKNDIESIRSRAKAKDEEANALAEDRQYVATQNSTFVKEFEQSLKDTIEATNKSLTHPFNYQKAKEGSGLVYFLHGSLSYEFEKTKVILKMAPAKDSEWATCTFCARQTHRTPVKSGLNSVQNRTIVWYQEHHDSNRFIETSQLALDALAWLIDGQTPELFP